MSINLESGCRCFYLLSSSFHCIVILQEESSKGESSSEREESDSDSESEGEGVRIVCR